MIDLAHEEVITFAEAAKRLPHRRGGRPTHVSTVFRWAQRGLRGVKLEYIQLGGTRVTSVEALGRFFDRLTTGGGNTPRQSSARRQAAVAQAEARLAKAGI